MTPRTQAILVGGGVGLAVWVGWFIMYAKGAQPHLEVVARDAAPQIAEDAAKAYIAQRYGLTPEIMHRIAARAGVITSLVNIIQTRGGTST